MDGRHLTLAALLLMSAVLASPVTASPATSRTASPCDGVDRTLSDIDRREWPAPIATQLGVAKVDVLQSLAFGGWHIVYVNTHQSDQAFLFYAGDPRTHRYVTLWAGAAMADEEQEIFTWAIHDAPAIPARLAQCFAWHVTKHRDQ